MTLEDYFDFVSETDIRIKGSRIGIETILTEYLDGRLAEYIVMEYPSLSLEQVHATITYFLRNREAMEAYLARLDEWSDQRRREQSRSSVSPTVERLRRLRVAAEPS